MHQTLPATKNRCAGLLLSCLGLNKTHLGLTSRDGDRLGIGRIILLALHEGAHILRRNQFYLVAKSFHLVRRVVRAAASFKMTRQRSC